MIAYFGEVVKMCANISYLMMTLNRYLLVGNEHATWLVTIAKLEFKWVVRGSILFSALINIGHGWEYQVGEDLDMIADISEQFSLHSEANGYSFSDYPQANQGMPYLIYSIVYFVLNFGFFFILNTAIEVKIVRRMHKEMKDKRERMAKLNVRRSFSIAVVAGSDAAAANLLQSDEEKKKEEEDLKKEKRVIKMVVLNGIINFVLRAPDMLFWLENQSIWSSLLSMESELLINDFSPGLLSLILDVGYLSYILTFTTNFFIFCYFNSKFKEVVVFYTVKPKN
jgi:hypothetical protein